MKSSVYRVIDANFNRAREGLRVCEEFARFFLNDRALTGAFKKARSRVSLLYNNFSGGRETLLAARDAKGDVAKKGFAFEKRRAAAADVFRANLQRTKEALRVLEEFLKLTDARSSDTARALRYKLYELEKAAHI